MFKIQDEFHWQELSKSVCTFSSSWAQKWIRYINRLHLSKWKPSSSPLKDPLGWLHIWWMIDLWCKECRVWAGLLLSGLWVCGYAEVPLLKMWKSDLKPTCHIISSKTATVKNWRLEMRLHRQLRPVEIWTTSYTGSWLIYENRVLWQITVSCFKFVLYSGLQCGFGLKEINVNLITIRPELSCFHCLSRRGA